MEFSPAETGQLPDPGYVDARVQMLHPDLEQPESGFLNNRTLNRVRQAAAGLVMVGISVMNVPHSNSSIDTLPQPRSPIEVTGHPLPDLGQSECPPVDELSIEVAEQLLQAPEDPAMRAEHKKAVDGFIAEAKKDGWKTGGIPTEITDRADFIFRQGLADQLGLTIYDPMPYQESLREDAAFADISGSELPFVNYETQAKSYLANFGIELRAVTEDDKLLEGMTPVPKKEQLETTMSKWNIYQLIETFSRYPQEFVDLSKVKYILYTHNSEMKTADGLDIAAYTLHSEDGKHDTIVINLAHNIDESIGHHEMWHHVHDELCGGPQAMDSDPIYTQYNNGEEYQKPYDNFELDLNGLISDMYTIQDSLRGAQAANDHAAFDKYIKQLHLVRWQLQNYSMVSDYSDRAIPEDEAEMAAAIPNRDGLVHRLREVTPRIYEKLKVQFYRLYHYAPKVAEFFSRAAAKPVEPDPIERSQIELETTFWDRELTPTKG